MPDDDKTTPQVAKQDNGKMHLSTLNGLRCYACLSVVWLHTHYFFGAHFFPLGESCMQQILNLPILAPMFFGVTFHMVLFWILSGFLCEYQLDRLVAAASRTTTKTSTPTSLPFAVYGRFLLNRLIRLYPLYFLNSAFIYYLGATSNNDDNEAAMNIPTKCTTSKMIETLFFVLRNEPVPAGACANVGWSVMVDVHGYIALVLLHATLSESLRQKLLPFYYLATVAYMAFLTNQCVQQHTNLTWEDRHQLTLYGSAALEFRYDSELDNVQATSGIPSVRALWPQYQFYTDYWIELRSLRQSLTNARYFTSIHKHGSAFFLGSILYMKQKQDLQDRRQGTATSTSTTSVVIIMCKLLVALAILHVSHYDFIFAGIPAYILVDVVLSISNNSSTSRQELQKEQNGADDATTATPQSSAERFVKVIFANPLWNLLAPYTYGIYMVHIFVQFGFLVPQFQDWVAQMQQNDEVHHPCNDYNLTFILSTTLTTVIISWIVAVILYHTVEWPFRQFRKRLNPFHSISSSSTVIQPESAAALHKKAE